MKHTHELLTAWLEEHASRDVAEGVRRLVWEDRARWDRTPGGHVLVALPDDATVLLRIEHADWGMTDEFWRRVES